MGYSSPTRLASNLAVAGMALITGNLRLTPRHALPL